MYTALRSVSGQNWDMCLKLTLGSKALDTNNAFIIQAHPSKYMKDA